VSLDALLEIELTGVAAILSKAGDPLLHDLEIREDRLRLQIECLGDRVRGLSELVRKRP